MKLQLQLQFYLKAHKETNAEKVTTQSWTFRYISSSSFL